MSNDLEDFEIEHVVYINDNLILKFLKVFSRAEYALKKSGFNNYKNTEVDAKAYWDNFADTIEEKFSELDDDSLNLSVAYIWNNPSKKQKLTDKKTLEFKDFLKDSTKTLKEILNMVRTVRNNLFHGGKHTPPEAQVDDSDRNEQLINASIIIIKACMKLNADVAQHYSK